MSLSPGELQWHNFQTHRAAVQLPSATLLSGEETSVYSVVYCVQCTVYCVLSCHVMLQENVEEVLNQQAEVLANGVKG